MTRDARFLETAQLCADYYIESTPEDGVPLMDYDFPADTEQRRESSAAAITARSPAPPPPTIKMS